MTTSTLSLPTAAGTGRLLGVAGMLGRSLVALMQAFRHRRDLRVLAAFDDRMLADIGLTRGDLRDAVAEPLWHDPTAVLVTRVHERRRTLRGIRPASYRFVQAPPLAPEPARVHEKTATQTLRPYY